ncbi:hypothetical protein M527_03885 [Sphingobium indicum IP26]|uniref:Uncharacterized protein n=2 Tax=Sphingobium TaxID=165695 RepID=T0IZR8_9SPHN|nr:hypothetical protein M527_03885 [Sphingobium indicum IP26]EQB31221.1 hypothetical protein M529_15900 [Sphingobium ummariense RL-3]KER38006.1 hypothetical protein AL00_01360 [Sphingobium indicum F2]
MEAFLGAADDLADGHLIRWSGETHAAGATANGFDEAVVRQGVDDLHQVIVGDIISPRDFADRTQALFVKGQVNQDPQ